MSVLPPRPRPIELPSYSLTGDLMSYDRCPLQYRYFTRTKIRSSHPVQQWYGNFLHIGMRSAYDRWREGVDPSSFRWSEPLEGPYAELVEQVSRRLRGQGHFRPATMGEVAEKRLLRAVRVLGPLVFPLIKEAEVRLSAARRATRDGANSATVYQITGVVDVLAATSVAAAPENALVAELLNQLGELPAVKDLEVILDYKGMSRSEMGSMLDAARQQIRTYAWLRNRRAGGSVVAAGAVVFVNDLLDADDDVNIDPEDDELAEILARSLVPVEVSGDAPEEAARFFDERALEIEERQAREGTAALSDIWEPRPERDTCVACDARYHCPESAIERPPGTRGVIAPNAP